jgi:hypothetical protein
MSHDIDVLQERLRVIEGTIEAMETIGSQEGHQESHQLIPNLRTERDVINAAISESDPNAFKGTARTDIGESSNSRSEIFFTQSPMNSGRQIYRQFVLWLSPR